MAARGSAPEARRRTSPPGWSRSADARASSASAPRDPAGRILAEELRGRGVELAGPEVEAGTGTVVSIATPDGARTMLSDRGVSTELRAGGARRRLARRLRMAARPRLQPRALAAPGDGSGRGRAARRGSASTSRRPRRSRRSAWSLPRHASATLAPAGRLRERGRGRARRRRRGADDRGQARSAGLRRRDARRDASSWPRARRRGRRHDRGRRRVRGRLPPRRPGGCPRRSRPLRRQDGSDALMTRH